MVAINVTSMPGIFPFDAIVLSTFQLTRVVAAYDTLPGHFSG